MRAPDVIICTQFEFHDCEGVSLIKDDALSVEAMNKIHNSIDLLYDNGYTEKKETLKETYESLISIYNHERNDHKMWEMVWNHEINSLFQMEKQLGIKGIATLKPMSVDDLTILNSTISLMAQEHGDEMPIDKLSDSKQIRMNGIQNWKNMVLERKKRILELVLWFVYCTGTIYGTCVVAGIRQIQSDLGR